MGKKYEEALQDRTFADTRSPFVSMRQSADAGMTIRDFANSSFDLAQSIVLRPSVTFSFFLPPASSFGSSRFALSLVTFSLGPFLTRVSAHSFPPDISFFFTKSKILRRTWGLELLSTILQNTCASSTSVHDRPRPYNRGSSSLANQKVPAIIHNTFFSRFSWCHYLLFISAFVSGFATLRHSATFPCLSTWWTTAVAASCTAGSFDQTPSERFLPRATSYIVITIPPPFQPWIIVIHRLHARDSYLHVKPIRCINY